MLQQYQLQLFKEILFLFYFKESSQMKGDVVCVRLCQGVHMCAYKSARARGLCNPESSKTYKQMAHLTPARQSQYLIYTQINLRLSNEIIIGPVTTKNSQRQTEQFKAKAEGFGSSISATIEDTEEEQYIITQTWYISSKKITLNNFCKSDRFDFTHQAEGYAIPL